MLELIIGKGRQVRVCMQVMDMAAADTALAIALVRARGVCARESSSLRPFLLLVGLFVPVCLKNIFLLLTGAKNKKRVRTAS